MKDPIVIKNIYYMLSYTYNFLNKSYFEDIKGEPFENIYDLFSAILIKALSFQIKKGLQKEYSLRIESIPYVRGKVDTNKTIKDMSIIQKKLVCNYDHFSENTNLNQILKSTILLLIANKDVTLDNRRKLKKLSIYFSEVETICLLKYDFSALHYNKNNSSYILIKICELISEGLILTYEKGKYSLARFLDDRKMHVIFEKFVLNFYKKEFPKYSPKSSYIDWNVEGDNFLLPKMKSDVMLSNSEKTLIIDTKYYSTLYTFLNSRNLFYGNV